MFSGLVDCVISWKMPQLEVVGKPVQTLPESFQYCKPFEQAELIIRADPVTVGIVAGSFEAHQHSVNSDQLVLSLISFFGFLVRP